jgi:hypothetical protein
MCLKDKTLGPIKAVWNVKLFKFHQAKENWQINRKFHYELSRMPCFAEEINMAVGSEEAENVKGLTGPNWTVEAS